jgi:hypothetical protein
MRIIAPDNDLDGRILRLSSGEFVTERQLINMLLPSGSFANRQSVEGEVRMLFALLAAIVDFATQRKKNEQLAQVA